MHLLRSRPLPTLISIVVALCCVQWGCGGEVTDPDPKDSGDEQHTSGAVDDGTGGNPDTGTGGAIDDGTGGGRNIGTGGNCAAGTGGAAINCAAVYCDQPSTFCTTCGQTAEACLAACVGVPVACDGECPCAEP